MNGVAHKELTKIKSGVAENKETSYNASTGSIPKTIKTTLKLPTNIDDDIERHAREFASANGLSAEKLAASWRSATFLELFDIDIKFPVGLTLSGAVAFCEISKANQWLKRKAAKEGVDVFLKQTFAHILNSNYIPTSLIKVIDEPLFDRIIRAIADKHPIPENIVHDLIRKSPARPKLKTFTTNNIRILT